MLKYERVCGPLVHGEMTMAGTLKPNPMGCDWPSSKIIVTLLDSPTEGKYHNISIHFTRKNQTIGTFHSDCAAIDGVVPKRRGRYPVVVKELPALIVI